jgi:hypothetical protein
MIKEHLNTVSDGDRISGKITIEFVDVLNNDFLRYRANIRQMVTFGDFHVTHTEIEERALINERKELKGEVPPASSHNVFPEKKLTTCEVITEQRVLVGAKPGKTGKRNLKTPYLTRQFREFFENMKGLTHTEILIKFHNTFRNKHFKDDEIIAMFNKAQGIV